MKFKSAVLYGLMQVCVLLAFVQPAFSAPAMPLAPVSGQISSNFGWRTDPMGGGHRFHAGVDIAAPTGTPVYVPQNGYVAFSGEYKGYGNMVVIDHGYGLYTLYGHASALYVQAGQAVSRGQAIAAVGTTGRSTGPHLHFEVHQNGQYVNPMTYLTYISQGMPMNSATTTASLPALPSNSGPIQVSVSSSSPQPTYLTALAKSESLESNMQPPTPVSSTLAMGGPLTVGNPSKGMMVQVPGQATQKAAPKISKASSVSKKQSVSHRVAKRMSRYLLSNAVQVVSGQRRNWVRF